VPYLCQSLAHHPESFAVCGCIQAISTPMARQKWPPIHMHKVSGQTLATFKLPDAHSSGYSDAEPQTDGPAALGRIERHAGHLIAKRVSSLLRAFHQQCPSDIDKPSFGRRIGPLLSHGPLLVLIDAGMLNSGWSYHHRQGQPQKISTNV
jgi:hypothetical protein